MRRGWIARLGLLLALAPVYWLGMLAALLFYQDAAGRFLMAPVALAGATWGVVLHWRPLAWGLAGVAVTAAALALLNDSKRPSGVPLLERPAPASYWSEPRWRAQGFELDLVGVDHHGQLDGSPTLVGQRAHVQLDCRRVRCCRHPQIGAGPELRRQGHGVRRAPDRRNSGAAPQQEPREPQ